MKHLLRGAFEISSLRHAAAHSIYFKGNHFSYPNNSPGKHFTHHQEKSY